MHRSAHLQRIGVQDLFNLSVVEIEVALDMSSLKGDVARDGRTREIDKALRARVIERDSALKTAIGDPKRMFERGEGKADVADNVGATDIDPVVRQSVAKRRLFQNVFKKGSAQRSALLRCNSAIVPFRIQLIDATGVEVGWQPF